LVDASTASIFAAAAAAAVLAVGCGGLRVLGPDADLIGLLVDLADAGLIRPGFLLGRFDRL
jgi:hypothetical protein